MNNQSTNDNPDLYDECECCSAKVCVECDSPDISVEMLECSFRGLPVTYGRVCRCRECGCERKWTYKEELAQEIWDGTIFREIEHGSFDYEKNQPTQKEIAEALDETQEWVSKSIEHV